MKTLYDGTPEVFAELELRLSALSPSTAPSNIWKFESLLKEISALSKDPVKGVGSVLLSPWKKKIIATGYNGLPYGIPDISVLLDPEVKNAMMMHSELNLLANAAELGVCTAGGILLCSKYPCHICAGALVTAGISQVITYRVSTESDWLASNKIAGHIFRLAQVGVGYFDES